MELHIDMRKGQRRAFIEAAVSFYIKELNLTRSRYLLTVLTDKELVSGHGCYGGVIQADKDIIGMVLDSRLPAQQLVQTIAHEMVHVKQIARGRLQNRIVKNEMVNFWCGQQYTHEDLAYHKRPWELEAFRHERELAFRLWEIIGGESK
jgi:hypothetical protein